MKHISSKLFLFILIISTHGLMAQNISIPDSISGWQPGWVASLYGSQAAYNNWSQGGVSSISGTASSVFTLLYRDGRYGYGFRANLKYGQANIHGQGVRKTDDVLSLRNRFTYTFNDGGTLAAYAMGTLETQFDRGYEYDAGPNGEDIYISNFFAPAYLTEGAGIAYSPSDFLQFQAGLALKQTFVMQDELAPVYGLDPGDNFRNEAGLTTGLNFEKEVATDIVYIGSLSTFTNVAQSISSTDVIWSNEIVGQINRLINATFQFELRYDDDFSSEVQLKQVLSAGISVNLY